MKKEKNQQIENLNFEYINNYTNDKHIEISEWRTTHWIIVKFNYRKYLTVICMDSVSDHSRESN